MQTTRQMNAATGHWVLTCVFWAYIAVRNHEAKIVALLDDMVAVSEQPVGKSDGNLNFEWREWEMTGGKNSIPCSDYRNGK